MTTQPAPDDALITWFREALDAAGSRADWQSQPFSYDNTSDYDYLCAALIQRASQVWQFRYGVSPTPGQLQNALWAAEFERSRQQRQQTLPWWRKLFPR
jgi:hypothetical protein